jgi:hypothetical protein
VLYDLFFFGPLFDLEARSGPLFDNSPVVGPTPKICREKIFQTAL